MLLAGDVMGDYELVATIHATGQVVGSAKFRVVNEWDDPDSSPNYWFAGERDLPGPQPTWGGGDPERSAERADDTEERDARTSWSCWWTPVIKSGRPLAP